MSLADLDDDRPDDAGPAAATETAAAAETGAPAKSKAELRAEAKAAKQAAKAEKAEKAGKTERSPAMAWLALIAEVVVGLAVGVGLFWGFTELWRWNVYFALVLAVLVIFGIVTFSHLVRKSNDLITTLLALAVGLIVTIGPLVLLAT
nr:hypothetical protein [Gordonia sp. NB41Y]